MRHSNPMRLHWVPLSIVVITYITWGGGKEGEMERGGRREGGMERERKRKRWEGWMDGVSEG